MEAETRRNKRRHHHHPLKKESPNLTTTTKNPTNLIVLKQERLALAISIPIVLILVSIGLGVGLYYGLGTGASNPITTPVVVPTLPPYNPPCAPTYPPDVTGYMLQRAGNSNARLYVPDTLNFLDQVGSGAGFTVAYWFQLPNFIFSSQQFLDAFCRIDNGGFFYQIQISAQPALPGDTNKAYLTITLNYTKSGTIFEATNTQVAVNLSAWNQFTYAVNFHQDTLNPTGFLLDGFTVWVNGTPYTTQTNYQPPRPPNPTLYEADVTGVSLNFGALANIQPTTNFRNMAYFLAILNTGQVNALVQNFNNLYYALTLQSCIGAWLLGFGDTSYQAFYSQQPLNCVGGLISGNVQVLPYP